MAKRKRSTRRSSSAAGSGPALLAIVALCAAGWWTASGGKHPDFSWVTSRLSIQKETEKSSFRPKEATTPAKPRESVAKVAPPVAARIAASKPDAPRPPLPVRPEASPRNPVSQIAVVRPPAPLKANGTEPPIANIPVGRPQPGTTPSAIYAKDRITIREHAWDRSAAIGTVERGREMRSYGKTGKWHRVVVPSTDMIGWVHDDMIARSRPSDFITGSIFGAGKRE